VFGCLGFPATTSVLLKSFLIQKKPTASGKNTDFFLESLKRRHWDMHQVL